MKTKALFNAITVKKNAIPLQDIIFLNFTERMTKKSYKNKRAERKKKYFVFKNIYVSLLRKNTWFTTDCNGRK